MGHRLVGIVSALAALQMWGASFAAAEVISLNAGVNMTSSDVAGAPGARDDNWNNGDAAGTSGNLTTTSPVMSWTGNVDGSGNSVATTAVLHVFSTSSPARNNGFNNQTADASIDDAEMFRSTIDLFGAGTTNPGTAANPSATLTVSDIPYALYDVYVYQGGGTVTRTAGVELNDTRAEYMRQAAANANDSTVPYVESDHTTAPTANTAAAVNAVPQAHYVRFTDVSGSTLQLDLWGDRSSEATPVPRYRFPGIQIVEVPEPASAGLLAAAAIGLLVRRRRSA